MKKGEIEAMLKDIQRRERESKEREDNATARHMAAERWEKELNAKSKAIAEKEEKLEKDAEKVEKDKKYVEVGRAFLLLKEVEAEEQVKAATGPCHGFPHGFFMHGR